MKKRLLALVGAFALTCSVRGPAQADAGSILVFSPASAKADKKYLGTIEDIAKALGKCAGWSASVVDLGKALPSGFGAESADVFVSTASGNPPQVSATFTDGSHQRVGVATIKTDQIGATNLCDYLPPLTSAVDTEPLRTANFYTVIPDADTDRPFADLLLFRLRQFGYDGQLAAQNFDQSLNLLTSLCASKRHALRYHVIQDSNEIKVRGSTDVTTAVGASVLSCGSPTGAGKLDSQPLDTISAAPKSQRHYVSFGTLVSSLVAVAVALKPKISTPQLTTAEPLVTALIDQPNTLTKANRDAVSESFRYMLCTLKYTGPNHTYVTPTPPPRGQTSPEYDAADRLGCVGSRFTRKPTGAFQSF